MVAAARAGGLHARAPNGPRRRQGTAQAVARAALGAGVERSAGGVSWIQPAFVMQDALRRAGERPLLLMSGGRSRTGGELEATVGSLAATLASQGLVAKRVGLWH